MHGLPPRIGGVEIEDPEAAPPPREGVRRGLLADGRGMAVRHGGGDRAEAGGQLHPHPAVAALEGLPRVGADPPTGGGPRRRHHERPARGPHRHGKTLRRDRRQHHESLPRRRGGHAHRGSEGRRAPGGERGLRPLPTRLRRYQAGAGLGLRAVRHGQGDGEVRGGIGGGVGHGQGDRGGGADRHGIGVHGDRHGQARQVRVGGTGDPAHRLRRQGGAAHRLGGGDPGEGGAGGEEIEQRVLRGVAGREQEHAEAQAEAICEAA